MSSPRRPDSPSPQRPTNPVGLRRAQLQLHNQRVRLSPRFRLPRQNGSPNNFAAGRINCVPRFMHQSHEVKVMDLDAATSEARSSSAAGSRWVWNKRYHSTPPNSPILKKALYRRDDCYEEYFMPSRPCATFDHLPILILADIGSRLDLLDREAFKLVSRNCWKADDLAWAKMKTLNLLHCIGKLFPSRSYMGIGCSENRFRSIYDFEKNLSSLVPYMNQMTSLSTLELSGTPTVMLKLHSLQNKFDPSALYPNVTTLKMHYCVFDRSILNFLASTFPNVDNICMGLFGFFFNAEDDASTSVWKIDEATPEACNKEAEDSEAYMQEAQWTVVSSKLKRKLPEAYIAAHLCKKTFTNVKHMRLSQF